MPELEPRYRILETKRLRDCVRSWKPELYLDSGKEIYPLRDALQDSYMALLLQEACTYPAAVWYALSLCHGIEMTFFV